MDVIEASKPSTGAVICRDPNAPRDFSTVVHMLTVFIRTIIVNQWSKLLLSPDIVYQGDYLKHNPPNLYSNVADY